MKDCINEAFIPRIDESDVMQGNFLVASHLSSSGGKNLMRAGPQEIMKGFAKPTVEGEQVPKFQGE